MNVVHFAHQVLAMQERIEDLEIENERLRKYEADYHELMNSSLSHNAAMMGNILKLCTTPGVVEACVEHRSFERG
jgi:hypothetical protein